MRNDGCLVLLFSIACAACDGSQQERFVGTWNYALPNDTTGLNIAALDCPASENAPALQLGIPQIGNIALSAFAEDMLSGTTDQGCMWSFKVTDGHAELNPPAQTCFNPVIGSGYTITHWSLDLTEQDDAVASEHVIAVSHHEVDCSFVLAAGRRNKVASSATRADVAAFEGHWSYQVPDASGVNMAQLTCDGAAPSFEPLLGALDITALDAQTIAVRTPEGCSAQLHVQGNTAELVADSSDCAGKGVLPEHWSMASDGVALYQVVSGQSRGCGYLVSNSRLQID